MAVVETGKTGRNTWAAKAKRTLTSVLPVDRTRKGQCTRCGACCKLPNVCPWLRYDSQGRALCRIYLIRPLNCRKYPRTKSELITEDSCGYSFD